jgi:hypothetical protein
LPLAIRRRRNNIPAKLKVSHSVLGASRAIIDVMISLTNDFTPLLVFFTNNSFMGWSHTSIVGAPWCIISEDILS